MSGPASSNASRALQSARRDPPRRTRSRSAPTRTAARPTSSRQQLASAGLDAYVVAVTAQDGVARYRVRVGTYRSREEAVSAAERIRAQRSLPTFVTPK